MNQRIRELANQCNFTDADIEDMSPGFEKFAELIVQECGRYLDSPEFIGRRDLDWSIVLNEYFGIKE